MKFVKCAILATGLALSMQAHAWFFVFIPGPATVRAIGDAITGAKGNICVKEGTKQGDVLTSPTGNTATVLSVSGTSSICQNPALPIRAELEFQFSFTSTAGIELSEDYEPKQLADFERFNGILLKAISKNTRNQGIVVSATTRKSNLDLQTLANNIERSTLQNPNFKEVKSENPQQLVINGLPALRWEIVGALKGMFGPKVTYLYTLLEGDKEFILVNSYGPTDLYAEKKTELSKIAEGVTGIHAAQVLGTSNLQANNSLASQLLTAPEQQIVPEAKTTTAKAPDSIEERLDRLNKMYKDGLITKDEYAAKKKEVLKNL